MSITLALLLAWLAAALTYRVLALRALAARCRPPSRPPPAAAPVSAAALRPLHGAGKALESCLESLLVSAERARMPVVLGYSDSSDPAGGVVEQLLERRPDAPLEVRIGAGPTGSNRKVANLIQMTASLDVELLLMSDADVRVPPEYLLRMTEPFCDPDVGLATGPYRSVPARGLASRIDALVTNVHFLPGTCAAVELEGLHFGLGASLAVRRSALSRAGGLGPLIDRAAEDYALARRVEATGLRLAWVPVLVEHVLEAEGWRPAWRRHLRWARVTRSVRPGGYVGQLLTHGWIPAALCGALTAAGAPLGFGLALAWWGIGAALLWQRRAPLGLAPRDLALLPLVDVGAFAIWVTGLVGRSRPPGEPPAASARKPTPAA